MRLPHPRLAYHIESLPSDLRCVKTPTDSFEETFKMSGEDVANELDELLGNFALDMPHSGTLRDWNSPLETVSDAVRWVDWVKSKQSSSVTRE